LENFDDEDDDDNDNGHLYGLGMY